MSDDIECDPCGRKRVPEQQIVRSTSRHRAVLLLVLGPWVFFIWWLIFFMHYGALRQYNVMAGLTVPIAGSRPESLMKESYSSTGEKMGTEDNVLTTSLRRSVAKPADLTTEGSPNPPNVPDLQKPSKKGDAKNISKQPSVPKKEELKSESLSSPSDIPNLLIVGAQKSGTTAIASWINLHRNVCKPVSVPDGNPVKEVQFFNGEKNWKQGVDFYRQHFRNCNENATILVDATPDYLPHADRVRETYDKLGSQYVKDLKILLILREPVAREYSWYNHMVVDCMKPDPPPYAKRVLDDDGKVNTFNAYLDTSVFPSIDTSYGHYAKWLRKWMDLFDRNQILVLSHEELMSEPVSVIHRLQKFLHFEGRSRMEVAVHNKRSGKVADVPGLSCKAQKRLSKVFEQSNKDLYELLNARPGPFEQRPFPKFQRSTCTPE